MSRNLIKDISSKSVKDYEKPIDFVKAVLDSVYHITGDYELYGHTLLSRRYQNSSDEEEKKAIAKYVVQLLDDPDYACDAIPVAAELSLEEAKSWFINLSKKSIEEIRNVKTNDYINGFICLLNYSGRYDYFSDYLKGLLDIQSLTYLEKLTIINKIAIHEPNYVIKNYNVLLQDVLNKWGGREVDKKNIIYDSLYNIFEKLGSEQCLVLAKRMKNEASKELQTLYYDSLRKLPKYQPYLPELKKILEINE